MKRPIVYYISSHGYGHGTRAADIIRALNTLDQPVIVISNLPLEFLRARMPSPLTAFRPGAFDVGLIQSDSIRADVDATFSAVQELYAREAELVAQECAYLQECNATAVVSDVAAIPITTAKQLGLPAVAVGNFSWDWIYAELNEERWQPYVQKFATAYAQTDLLLRLPFACPMDAFPCAIDVPLLAEPTVPDRETLAQLTGADATKPWVLISLVQVAWDDEAIRAIETLTDYEFFTVQPLSFPGTRLHCVDRQQMSFPQILASCDIAITKPGFGIVSECIANDTPIIYTDRQHFAEYDYLVRDIKRYIKNAHISGPDFYAGQLGPALAAVQIAPPAPDPIAHHGANFAAERIMELLSR